MRIIALFSTLLLMACAGEPPPPETRYLLRAETPLKTARVEAPVSIGLRSVQVATYLTQPGLVIETGAHQMRAARYQLWSEPLAEGLLRFLRAEISNALGYDVSADAVQRKQWDYAVEVRVDQLHGTLTGDALLSASWRVTRGGNADEMGKFRFTRLAPLARDGYAALVEAEIGLLGQLASAIADSLRELVEQRAAD
jgi:uncharacterized lipoprotein YmbA